MNMKEFFLKNIIKKFDNISSRALKYKDYETALEAISSSAMFQYMYNQTYIDTSSENNLLKIANSFNVPNMHSNDRNAILFYDGFGLDNRGLALVYIKALINLGFHIIYVTLSDSGDDQPTLLDILKQADAKIYIQKNCFTQNEKIEYLNEILDREHFDNAFFYSTPWDVSGIVSFNAHKNKFNRFLINLTDHAFWLGLNSFDYIIEFRDYGACVSNKYRKIDKEKIFKLPFYPEISKLEEFKGFPFESENKIIVTSGGAIYKTIDNDDQYYKLVTSIIELDDRIVFYYIGDGDFSKLDTLKKKYPSKVFFSNSRKDFFEVIKNSNYYLNTYPIGGNLMLQFAAKAKCVPVSLRREWDDDAKDVFINEKELNYSFTNCKDLLEDFKTLINDKSYYDKKLSLLDKSLVSENDFSNSLEMIITKKQSNYVIDYYDINTDKFIKAYLNNVKFIDVIDWAVTRNQKKAMKHFPLLCICKLFLKIKNKLGVNLWK